MLIMKQYFVPMAAKREMQIPRIGDPTSAGEPQESYSGDSSERRGI